MIYLQKTYPHITREIITSKLQDGKTKNFKIRRIMNLEWEKDKFGSYGG